MKGGGRGLAAGALLMTAALLSQAQSKNASLAERVAKLLDASSTTRVAFWGIQIVDVASGQTLYEALAK